MCRCEVHCLRCQALINKNCLDSRLINLSCRRKFLIPQFDPFSLQPECAQLLISTRLWPPQSPESGQCWPALIKTVFMMEDGPDQEGDEQSSPCLVSLFWLSWVTSNVEKYKIHDDGTKALSWILLITVVLWGMANKVYLDRITGREYFRYLMNKTFSCNEIENRNTYFNHQPCVP